jgi:hypothetical protein
MQNRTPRFRLLATSAAAALLLASGTALAQDGPRPNPNDTLRGPSVNDRAMPRQERFGDSAMQGRRQADDLGTYRFMVASINGLSDHDNQRLRLTPEQREKITEIQSAYQTALRAYMTEAREQTQNLRQRVQRAREDAGDDREAVQQIMERARTRAAEIRENAPKSERAEAAMWEILTGPQRRAVTAQMEERRGEMQRDRQMQREGRSTDAARPGSRDTDAPQRPGRRGAQTDTGPDAEADRPMRRNDAQSDGQRQRGQQADRQPDRLSDRPTDRQPDRANANTRRWGQLFQRIQSLSPEQQDRLYNMINQTLDRAERSAQARPSDRPQAPNADRPGRRGPGAGDDAPRPSDAGPDRPRRGQRPGSDRD